jgi:hypothetical protein
VQGRDPCLQHVGTATPQRQRTMERCPSLRDLVEVPERSILVAEEDDRPVGEASVAPGVVDQHQGQQPVYLGLVGHQLGERAAEPDRLGRELSATAVASLKIRYTTASTAARRSGSR